MKNRFVVRNKPLEEIDAAYNNRYIRLVQVKGIAGSGKTSLVNYFITARKLNPIWIDCRAYPEFSILRIVRSIAQTLLSKSQYNRMEEDVSASILEDSFLEAYATYSVEARDNAQIMVGGDLVVGNVVKKTEEDFIYEERLRAELMIDWVAHNAKRRNIEKTILVLDNFHEIGDQSPAFLKWIEQRILSEGSLPLLDIKLFVLSRRGKLPICPPNAIAKVDLRKMSREEVDELLESFNIENEAIKREIRRITKGHAQSIVLAALLANQIDLSSFEIQPSNEVLYDELCTKMMLEHIVKVEEDGLIRNALLTVPVFRRFQADQLGALLSIPTEKIQRVVTTLLDRGFIERSNSYFKYHDLLRDLTLSFLQQTQGRKAISHLHVQAAKAFLSCEDNLSLVNKVEPFYHFLEGDLDLAVEYSESVIKPALDRKERSFAAILLSHIDFDSLPSSSSKGWLLLRHGGYFRQFRKYPEAIEIFKEVVELSAKDKKLMASVLNNIGWVHLFTDYENSPQLAISYFQRSNEICMEENFPEILAMNYNNLGIATSRIAKDDHATQIDYYRKCLEITESKDTFNPLVSGMAYSNLGLIFREIGKLKDALEEFLRALESYRRAESHHHEAEVVFHIACLFLGQKDFAQARKFLENSLSRFQQHQDCDNYFFSENLFFLSIALERLNEFENMSDCLASILLVSLKEGSGFHLYTTRKVLRFINYLAAARGKEISKAALHRINTVWEKSDIGSKIPQMGELLLERVKTINQSIYWSQGRSKVIHELQSQSCTPRRWENVWIWSRIEENKFRLCKKCNSA